MKVIFDSEAPLLSKFGNLSIREMLVMMSAYARTDSGGGGEEGSPKTTRRGVENAIFFGGKSCGAFGQSDFFLARNRMTTVAIIKDVF